jgi:hypothetical protein
MSGTPNPRRVYHAGSREREPGIDAELLRALSERARVTRKPGQTLEARFDELRQECGA